MATSTTTAYNPTVQRMIDLALMDIGVAGQGGSVDPILRNQAIDHVNMILKELDAEAGLLWRLVRRVLPLVSGQGTYVLTNDVLELDQPARYTQSGATSGSQVLAMSRDWYMSLSDRTLQGTPYLYLVEHALDVTGISQVTMTLYPIPPTTGDTLEYAANLRGKDVTTLAETLDVPQKGLLAFRWGLAHSLSPSYGVDVGRMKYFNDRYKEAIEQLILDDNERGDVQIVPFGGQVGYGYGWWGTGGSR